MDLNPAVAKHLAPEMKLLLQDCTEDWAVTPQSLALVFTSNFLEHLPNKRMLGHTLDQAKQALRVGGLLVAMGPNVRFVPGAYWDFWDHHIALTEHSLAEALTNRGFAIERCVPRFLPYTMVNTPRFPLALIGLYLALPIL